MNIEISHLVYAEMNFMVRDQSVSTSTIIEKIMLELIPEKEWLGLDVEKLRTEFCCEYGACFCKYFNQINF
jgi:hypothetical protein